MTRIELHIERIVFDGIDPGHARTIGDALQADLQQRLAAGPAPELLRHDSMRHTLDGGTVTIGAQPQPAALGAALAGAVWQGITR